MSRSQKSAYDYYRRQREDTLWFRIFGRKKSAGRSEVISQQQRNANTAWYMAAVVVGALGATYAAVPLYKVRGSDLMRIMINTRML